jgi:hypothetical protein
MNRYGGYWYWSRRAFCREFGIKAAVKTFGHPGAVDFRCSGLDGRLGG